MELPKRFSVDEGFRVGRQRGVEMDCRAVAVPKGPRTQIIGF